MRIPRAPKRQVAHGLLGACSCLLFAGAGHLASGGRLPEAEWLAAAFLALAAAGVPLAGKRRGFDVIALIAGVAQFLLHLFFHYTAAPVHGAAHHSGQHSAHAVTWGAMVWHGIAGLAAALCVAYGERLVQRLTALVARTFLWVRAPLFAPPPRLRPAVAVMLPTLHGEILARSVRRRGPPLRVPA